MSEPSLKEALRVLAEQAVQRAVAHDRGLQYFSGATTFQDTRRDQIITELPGFVEARTALGSSPIVREFYGDGGPPDYEHAWERLVLQYVYGFLGSLPQPTFDLVVFEATWDSFWKELSSPEWHWIGFAQLANFHSSSDLLDLGEGTSIRRIDHQDLVSMGWADGLRERLWQERLRGFVASHGLVTEHMLPKDPENFIGNDIVMYGKATRTLLALRLFKGGNVRMGQMWLRRLDSFPFGLLGDYSMGVPVGFPNLMGDAYTFEEADLSEVCELYEMLLRYEEKGDKAPVNVNLALRSFSDVYERRDDLRQDTPLVDAITAAEALLGTRDEVTFKLAYRVAAILGSDDDERVRIFELMKGYYDTRSRVVHGGSDLFNKQGQLKDKPRWHLENQQDLRDFVRRLLVGFIRLAVTDGHPFDETFFRDTLDSALLHGTRRSELRAAMGFET
jgi:hypothetical protein